MRRSGRREASSLRWPELWRYVRVPLATAAVMVICLSAFLARRPGEDLIASEIVAAHVRSLMLDHLTDVASTDQHTVKPWFNGKLDFSPAVKDLGPQGFPLVGARLDYLENQPAAALVYKRRQHLINLFVRPSTQSETPERTLSRRGYHLITWTQAGMVYWAVSDLNPTELDEFARLARGLPR